MLNATQRQMIFFFVFVFAKTAIYEIAVVNRNL